MEVVAEYLAEGRPSGLGETIPVASNPSTQYLLSRKAPLVVEDAQIDPRLAPTHDLMRRRETVSMLLLPLIIEDEVVGSLGLDAIEPRSFSAQEVSLAWSVADQVAGALARTRLEKERRQLAEQYYQSQKMEAIGQLTGGVAHDFNNLLTAINGFAELMQMKLSPDDPHRELLGNILRSGRRAADLVRQLLAFSRKQIIEPRILDLNIIVTDLDKMLQRIIGEDVELKTVLAPDLWPVRVDPAQIEQVVVNLAVNARDAMPEGGRLTIETTNMVLDGVYISSHLEAKPGEHVLLAISDTGSGISEEDREHIFEPFFTTKETGRGTGLGLATVYGIVKQSEGDIQVYSEKGIGTTFKVYLPRVKGTASSMPRVQDKSEIPTGTETVLLVEDDQSVRELSHRVLEYQGYTVLEARNAEEALQLSIRYPKPVHLLLVDVVMPGMNGRALAEELAKTRPDMKTLFMSGYTGNAIARHGVLDPGVAFIQKPFSPAILTRRVREILDE
jgi:signal transduction histidine kinase